MSNKIEFDYKEVSNLAARGLTQQQVALALGVSLRTVANRLVDDQKFADAFEKGRAKGLAKVADALFRNATQNNNTAAQIFIMKARGGWKEVDKQEIEVNQPFQFIIKNDLPPDDKSL